MQKSMTLFALGLAVLATSPATAQTASPTAPELEFAFEAHILLGQPAKLGETAIGGRNIVPIIGGRFAGPGMRGEILSGGWDWQLERRDGCIGIKADYMLKTDDGVVINIVDSGVNCLSVKDYAKPPRTTPVFEVPEGKYDWLGRSAFIGAATPFSGPDGSGLDIRFYRVN